MGFWVRVVEAGRLVASNILLPAGEVERACGHDSTPLYYFRDF